MFVNSKFSYFAVPVLLLVGTFAVAQDEPSLGDLVRQQRAKKEQQAKTGQAKDAKPTKVITNEELPQHTPNYTAQSPRRENQVNLASSGAEAAKQSADQWQSQIANQKSQIVSLQKQIDDLNGSIQFAPGNCVEGCAQWNQKQQEKQQQVERMRADLEQQKTQLDKMQESARSQGYGSSVWDP